MHLKELSINGFKSFAKKSELEFSASITAIVGPNGSGKSNIAESFRFVLGEQSVKSLRGKRGEDLIWGGSEKITRGNRASVVVVFDNKSRTFALDFDEVKIERVVHRDGQNEYKLNDSSVRLKDVHELLANANIGSTGHHIISQGEADRVLAAGPRERREMIEDALGLKVYQLKKQETERKLERTKENIAQVESLRREAAPHLTYLKKQVEKAERSLALQKELRVAYAEYLKREDTYVAVRHDALLEQKRGPVEQLAMVEDRLRAVKTTLEKSTEKKENTALIAVEEKLHTAVQHRQLTERELSKLEGQMSFLKRRLETPVATTIKEQVIDRKQLESLVTELTTIAERSLDGGDEAMLKHTLQELIQRLKSFLEHDHEVVVETVNVDATELAALEQLVKKAETAVVEAKVAEVDLSVRVNELKREEVADTEKNHEAEREMFSLINERRELEAVIRTIDSELVVLERDRTDFKQQLQEAVALLGRGAADYYACDIVGDDGQILTDEQIVREDRGRQRDRQYALEKLKIRLEELGVGATEELLKEFNNAKERDEFLARELADLAASVDNLGVLIKEMEDKIHEQFADGLIKITKEFHTFFTLMFGGGSATLERVMLKQKSDDESEVETARVEEGVELSISLPNKRVKGLEMLSGGERALTSIALIFAMSQVNPPPFIILDETDAALDEANSRRYGDMIEALAKRSQLVLITHNRETMSRAGILYGITMGIDGVSKVLSVKFDEAAAVAK